MTTDRHLALMALMNEITAPAKTYNNCLRRAAATDSNSHQYDAAVERGNAALDDIETAVRHWVAKHPVDAPRDKGLDALLPAWEAMYEPGNVSDYLIGYANDECAAKAAAEAWMRSQSEVTGRLEWTEMQLRDGDEYTAWFDLVQRHDDGVDTGPGITVRHRRTPAV